MFSGHSYQGSLHVYNQTLINWHSKKQATVETATYGSKYTASHTTINQAVDHCLYLCYLGIPVYEKSYLFGDNKSMVDSSMMPHSKLHKHHNVLS
jgi:hypothetical protein